MTETTERKRIAIACEDDGGLNGEVSGHFGRCPYYTVVDVVDGEIVETRVEANPFFAAHRPGAVPQFVHGLGADVIVAGGMGPRAVQMFQQFGVEVATGAVGSARGVLGAYLDGRIRGSAPCNHDHPESCGGH